jgi:hypothetical protein
MTAGLSVTKKGNVALQKASLMDPKFTYWLLQKRWVLEVDNKCFFD